MGRDGYITYNDGGFWKDNIKQIKIKNLYPKNNYKIFHSLNHKPSPFIYYSDGTGRDGYVIRHNEGLIKTFNPMANQQLSNFLRKENENDTIRRKIFLTKSEKKYLNEIKKMQDNVVKRLYNGSFRKINNKKLKFNDNSINSHFNKSTIENNFEHISPIKDYKNKNSSVKKNIEKNNGYEKFINPSKENGQINLFDKILKNRKIYKNNYMNNIPYFQKKESNIKLRLIKNPKNNYSFNIYKNNMKLNKIDDVKNRKMINKSYVVAVGYDDLKRKNNFTKNNYSANNIFKDINSVNNSFNNNNI